MGGNNHCLRALADEVAREYCAGERYLASSADSHTKCRVLEAMCFDQAETHYHNDESVVSFYGKLVSLPADCVSSFLSTQALLETRRLNLAREIRMVERSICFDRHPPNLQRARVAVKLFEKCEEKEDILALVKVHVYENPYLFTHAPEHVIPVICSWPSWCPSLSSYEKVILKSPSPCKLVLIHIFVLGGAAQHVYGQSVFYYKKVRQRSSRLLKSDFEVYIVWRRRRENS
jgi:hypothetical protein